MGGCGQEARGGAGLNAEVVAARQRARGRGQRQLGALLKFDLPQGRHAYSSTNPRVVQDIFSSLGADERPKEGRTKRRARRASPPRPRRHRNRLPERSRIIATRTAGVDDLGSKPLPETGACWPQPSARNPGSADESTSAPPWPKAKWQPVPRGRLDTGGTTSRSPACVAVTSALSSYLIGTRNRCRRRARSMAGQSETEEDERGRVASPTTAAKRTPSEGGREGADARARLGLYGPDA